VSALVYLLIVAGIVVVACVCVTSVRVAFGLLAACIACVGCMAAQDGAVGGSVILFLEAAMFAVLAASRALAPLPIDAAEDTAT
jgi:hypothetical protein